MLSAIYCFQKLQLNLYNFVIRRLLFMNLTQDTRNGLKTNVPRKEIWFVRKGKGKIRCTIQIAQRQQNFIHFLHRFDLAPVILFSIDGFREDYLFREKTPNILKLGKTIYMTF